MRRIYIVMRIVVSGGLICCLTSCKDKQNAKQTENYLTKTDDTVKAHTLADNHYLDLRNMAFSVTPQQLKLSISPDTIRVFGVIMDWDLGNGIMSLISYGTGDASIYLSSGGGVIGGGQHENVSEASREFVAKAQSYLDKSSKIDSFPLPDKNCVRFYLLTNTGKYVAEETMSNIENNSSKWLGLFELGNKVISELRVTAEKK